MQPSKIVNVNSRLSFKSDGKGHWLPTDRGKFSEWSAHKNLEMMDLNNVSFNIFSQADTDSLDDPVIARGINEQYTRLINDYPSRFGGFATLPLKSISASLNEIQYALDTLHLNGVCLPSNAGGIYLGDPYYAEIWQELDRRGATVFIRPACPASINISEVRPHHEIFEFMFDITRVVTSLVYSGTKRRHPGIKVIVANGGGALPFLAWRLSYFASIFGVGEGKIESHDAILKDIQSFYFELTAAATSNSLPTILQLIKPGQLMMGFDFPETDLSSIGEAQKFIREYSDLNDSQKQMIYSGTAEKIIPRIGISQQDTQIIITSDG